MKQILDCFRERKYKQKNCRTFTMVLVERPNDITALLVLADYNFYSKNYIISKNYYQKLLSLIDKNS